MNQQLQITTDPTLILERDNLQRPILIQYGGLTLTRIEESSTTEEGIVSIIYRWLVTEIEAVEGTGKSLSKVPSITIASKTVLDRAVNSVPVLDDLGNLIRIDVIDGGFRTNADGSIDAEYGFDGNGLNFLGNTLYSGFEPPTNLTVEVETVKFRNQPSDDSDILDAAVKSAAAGLSFNIAKCGLDPGLSLIDDDLADLKKGLSGAVNAKGLNNLMASVNKTIGDLKANLPKAPEFPNFADQLTRLDLSDSAAIGAFKEKWGDIVGDIDGIISGDIDFCSIAKQNIQARVLPDGSYKKKVAAEPPKAPVTIPPQSVVTTDTVTPKPVEEEPKGNFETQFNINAKESQASQKEFVRAWSKLNSKLMVPHLRERKEAKSALAALKADEKYNLYRQLSAEKKLDSDNRLTLSERDHFSKQEQNFAVAQIQFKLRKQNIKHAHARITKYIMENAASLAKGEYFPPWSNDISDIQVKESLIGHNIFGTTAIYPKGAFDDLVQFSTAINNEIKASIWKKNIIEGFAKYLISRQSEGVIIS